MKMGARLGTIAGRFRIGMDVSQDEISPYVRYRIPLESGDSVSFRGSYFFYEKLCISHGNLFPTSRKSKQILL